MGQISVSVIIDLTDIPNYARLKKEPSFCNMIYWCIKLKVTVLFWKIGGRALSKCVYFSVKLNETN